ncbi:transcriptional regulator [Betaproteobacteria bacterium]|nr:transcriptional regulator [Betaproteobacteria bacterium]
MAYRRQSHNPSRGRPAEKIIGEKTTHEIESVVKPIQRITNEIRAPLYEIVKHQIFEAIVTGVWPPGTVIPSEITLAQELGVAIGTVRRALIDLVNDGLLSRKRKTGTVVIGRSPYHELKSFFQYFPLQTSDGAFVKSTVLVTDIQCVPADGDVSDKIGVPVGSDTICLRRIRFINEVPIMLDHFVLQREKFPNFPMKADEMPPRLFIFLLENYGMEVSAVKEQISAEMAGERDCELLSLTPPTAILKIDQIVFDQEKKPSVIGYCRAKTGEYVYVNEIK